MSPTLALFVGVAAGLFLSRVLFTATDSACCAEVAKGVREKVGDSLGAGAQQLGDALGVWPGLAGLASNLNL